MNIYSSKFDGSTNEVLDWIYFLNPDANVNRFNNYVIPDKFSIHLGKEFGKSVKSWYRRGNVSHNFCFKKINSNGFEKMNKSYETENKFVAESIFKILFDQNTSINTPGDNDTNKITNLKLAYNSGLDIPETFISNSVPEINQFLAEDKLYIIKDIALDPFVIEGQDQMVSVGINPIKLLGCEIKMKIKHLNESHANGFLFIQEYIEKRIELRIFYLNGKIYAMAIFSQSNEKTKTDYRNYDNGNPNRCIPFSLPKEQEQRISAFMNATALNCGSIDMIFSPEGKYVFLEVNPIGQFQWLSKRCNYPIERDIANFLLDDY
ncbi:hypothetical protein D3C87_129980 [compost metagenome]